MGHEIVDSGKRFVINPGTKTIQNASNTKLILVQWDHNSERITFETPKEIDGHDMSLCNKVEVHFINTDIDTKEQVPGLYTVEDLREDPDDESKVIFSWLISRQATTKKGALAFIVRFECVNIYAFCYICIIG